MFHLALSYTIKLFWQDYQRFSEILILIDLVNSAGLFIMLLYNPTNGLSVELVLPKLISLCFFIKMRT